MQKCVFGHVQRVKVQISCCTSVVSDQGRHCPLNWNFGYYRMYDWRAKAGGYYVHVQNAVNLCILGIFNP